MTRTMVALPDAIHKGLKHLAVERQTSMAQLIQEAVELLFDEDRADLTEAKTRWAQAQAHPDKLMDYSAYRSRRNSK